jgi:hypothetical protein
MNISLTGNPFVDTGYFVLASKAGLAQPEKMTWTDVQRIYADGLELARANARLSGFTMVFGTNGPLTQSSYRPTGKKKEPSDTNIKAYTSILSALLHEAMHKGRSGPICEVCGASPSFDFDATVRSALAAAGVGDPGLKQIGRDWFPLAGSPGNDAQALPAGSRGLHICARCLFAVHYMPMGLMLVQGKLACFQSNLVRIAIELTGDIAQEYEARLAASTSKIELLGKKEGTTGLTRRLMKWMQKRRDVAKELERKLDDAHLTIWLFSNSGTGADCELMLVPNTAVQFLWRVEREGLDKDLEVLLKSESKRADEQLLMRVQDGRDYSGLYPFKTYKGASPGLFALYHQIVLGQSHRSLILAQSLARQRIADATPKERKALQKSSALEGKNASLQRSRIKNTMLTHAVKDGFELDEYWQMFPISGTHPLRVDWRGWRTLGYFLVNAEVEDIHDYLQPVNDRQATTIVAQDTTMKPRSDIQHMAQLYFDGFVCEKGIKRFKRDIIDEFNTRFGSGLNWLRDIFQRLATQEAGFTITEWDEFVQDDYGEPQPRELVFQLRLALANLYREYLVRQGRKQE